VIRYLVVSSAVVVFVLTVGAGLDIVRRVTRLPSIVLTDEQCTPPCWNGIVPGTTSRQEAYSILEATRGVNFGTIFDETRTEHVAQFSWFFTAPIPDSTGRLFFMGEKVAAILIGTYGAVDLTEVLDMLGTPAAQWTHCAAARGEDWPQTVLLWPDEGYAVVVDHGGPCSELTHVRVRGSDHVAQVVYFVSSRLPTLLQSQRIFGPDSVAALAEARPWLGSALAR
jgi:hypothetical protein